MNEKEMKILVRDCLNQYHKEDKKILLDISVLQITCITYFLYNLIFFGNKIILSKETLTLIQNKNISEKGRYTEKQEIRARNAGYLLEAIQRDTRGNYQIIDMQQYGKSKKQRIRNYLLKKPDSIFYLEDAKLYQELECNKTRNQLCLLQIGMVEVNPFRSKNFKFETIGAIQFENRKMVIHTKEGALIKIYNSRGIEKTEGIPEVNPRDLVLIRGTKEDTYSFNLYEVVSRHTRNQAIRIIWTDLKKGQKSNKYIDRLPYQYKKMISDNVN